MSERLSVAFASLLELMAVGEELEKLPALDTVGRRQILALRKAQCDPVFNIRRNS